MGSANGNELEAFSALGFWIKGRGGRAIPKDKTRDLEFGEPMLYMKSWRMFTRSSYIGHEGLCPIEFRFGKNYMAIDCTI